VPRTDLKRPVSDQLEGDDGGALLFQRLRVRRHGARRYAADVRVVRTAGHIKHNLRPPQPQLTQLKHISTRVNAI
jgi:hypothetical protein